MNDIENQLIARYALTKYALMYITKGILINDEVGKTLIQSPNEFVKDVKSRQNLCQALEVA